MVTFDPRPADAGLVALVQPLPQFDTTLPTPNGYDELARIGEKFHGSEIMKGLAADTPDEQKLDAAVPKLEADFAALRKALDIPFVSPFGLIRPTWSMTISAHYRPVLCFRCKSGCRDAIGRRLRVARLSRRCS